MLDYTERGGLSFYMLARLAIHAGKTKTKTGHRNVYIHKQMKHE